MTGYKDIDRLLLVALLGFIALVITIVLLILKLRSYYKLPLDKQLSQKKGAFYYFAQCFFIFFFLVYFYLSVIGNGPFYNTSIIISTTALIFILAFSIINRKKYKNWFSRVILALAILTFLSQIIKYLFF